METHRKELFFDEVQEAFVELYEGTFLTLLRELRQQYNDKPALCCEGQSLSFFELLKRTEKSAVQLLKNGFSAGEKVVLWGYNSIEWVIAFLAVMSAGGTAVLMNYADENFYTESYLCGKEAVINTAFDFYARKATAHIKPRTACPRRG